jgi:Flp pilus assembly protein TadD
LLELGDYTRAVQDLTSALRIQQKDAEALQARGEAYLRLGDSEKAAEDFAEATKVRNQIGTPNEGASAHFEQ